MMEEVEAGRVEAIVIKDMSRLGRDYLKVGQVMELLSPCNSSSRLRRSYSGVIFSFLMAVPPETKML